MRSKVKPVQSDFPLDLKHSCMLWPLVLVLIWTTARLPVAVPDFHEVDHHHQENQSCLYHQHLNRWHEPETDSFSNSDMPSKHDAVFHVHWLLPGQTAPTGDSDNHDNDFSDSQNESVILTEMKRIVVETLPDQVHADPFLAILPFGNSKDPQLPSIQESVTQNFHATIKSGFEEFLPFFSQTAINYCLGFNGFGNLTCRTDFPSSFESVCISIRLRC